MIPGITKQSVNEKTKTKIKYSFFISAELPPPPPPKKKYPPPKKMEEKTTKQKQTRKILMDRTLNAAPYQN